MIVDFSRLRLKRSNNQYLVAPAAYAADTPHRIAPEFDRPVQQLAGDFRRHALSQPRVTLVDVTVDGLHLELVSRTPLLRIPDRISVEFIALAGDRSTLAVYSRAKYGSRDFGVNRQRTDAWLEALGAAAPSPEAADDQLAASPASA